MMSKFAILAVHYIWSDINKYLDYYSKYDIRCDMNKFQWMFT